MGAGVADDPMVDIPEEARELRRQRDARTRRSVAAGIAFQTTYILAQFVILAALFRHVGPEQFGMWVTVFGITAWLNLLPLGMDRAVLTWLGRVAYAQPTMVWRIVEGSVAVVALTTWLAAAAILLFGRLIPWDRVLNVHSADATAAAGSTAVAALTMMALSMLPAMGGLYLQAMQRGGTRHILGIVGQVLSVLLVLVGVRLGWSLPVLGVVIISPILTAGLLHCAVTWWVLPPRPPARLHAERVVAPMLTTGLGLWAVEVAVVLVVNSGPLLVAQSSGAAGVAPYAATYRLIGPLVVCFLMISQAYWPAFGDAANQGDHKWIGDALRRSAGLAGVVWLLGAAACLGGGRWFVAWWLGPEVTPGWGLITAGLVFALAYGTYFWSATVLSGLGHVRAQVVLALAVLAVYALAAWLGTAILGATGVFMLQGAFLGAMALANITYLARVLRWAAMDIR